MSPLASQVLMSLVILFQCLWLYYLFIYYPIGTRQNKCPVLDFHKHLWKNMLNFCKIKTSSYITQLTNN